ncbi:MAG: hypothetical protein GY847_23490 [Proteobacteria bacterium]|nr:hypothetical protein [Pseudomonadota bacterium]
MRCSEARRRLTGSRRDEGSIVEDRELGAHLESCPSCAREAKSAGQMRALLDGAAEDDTSAIVPQAVQQRTVEARTTSQAGPAGRLAAWWSGLRLLWWRRPAYGASLAFAAAVLALVTFVPFSYDKTLGYDVAFADVCREVALDDDQICDMLGRLGLGEAAVDLEGCDSLCNLNIICLRSEEEVAMVVTALQSLCRTEMTPSVIPMVDRASGSLLDRANERVFRKNQGG